MPITFGRIGSIVRPRWASSASSAVPNRPAALELRDRREGEDELARRLGVERRPRLEPAASTVSTPSGSGGVWAGARARKNQASKRREITSGVIQREKSTSSSSAASSIAGLLGQLAHRAGAVARLALAVGGIDARRPGRPRRRA